MKRQHKYGAKSVETHTGEKFPSKRELKRWGELQIMERVGEITGLVRQMPFELQPACQTATGEKLRPITYIADFVYNQGDSLVIEDCKGYRTEVFNIKWKMLKHLLRDEAHITFKLT